MNTKASSRKEHYECMHISFFCYFAPLLTDKLSFPSDLQRSPLLLSTCWCLPQVAGHWVINSDIVGNHGSPVKARCLWLQAGLLLSLVTKTVNTEHRHNRQTRGDHRHCLMSLSDVTREVWVTQEAVCNVWQIKTSLQCPGPRPAPAHPSIG